MGIRLVGASEIFCPRALHRWMTSSFVLALGVACVSVGCTAGIATRDSDRDPPADAISAAAPVPPAEATPWDTATRAWEETVPGILARIRVPTFRADTFFVSTFGAVADTTFDSRSAIQAAIETAHARGGGVVVLPKGEVRSNGPLHLRSGVNLHVPAGATLSFGWDSLDYRPVVLQRWEGTMLYNWSPLIYARDAHSIALTGGGTIHGNGRHWQPWRARQKALIGRLREMGAAGVPDNRRIFGDGRSDLDGDGRDDGFGDSLRTAPFRPDLVQLLNCTNVLIEGLTFRESPFWTVHPVLCRSVTIRGLTVRGHALNDDGIDPDSCEDVLVEDCDVDTVDDALAVKAGRDNDAWGRGPTRNLVVRRCRLRSTTNAWTIGSEMSGGVENVFVEDCRFTAPPDTRHEGNGIYFKCNLDRGGYVRHVYIRDCVVDTAKGAGIAFRMDYHGYRGGQSPPDFRDVYLDGVTIGRVTEGPALYVVGVEERPIRRLFVRGLEVGEVGGADVFRGVVGW